jgi:hypothetical protein
VTRILTDDQPGYQQWLAAAACQPFIAELQTPSLAIIKADSAESAKPRKTVRAQRP